MKRILALIMVAVVALFAITACGNSKAYRKQQELQEKEQAQYLQGQANRIVQGIQYIKDERTSVCFAYYFAHYTDGGPALATVPCEAIPPRLLWVVR